MLDMDRSALRLLLVFLVLLLIPPSRVYDVRNLGFSNF